MASQGADKSEQILSRTPSVRYRTRATYETLIRQSRKLGKTAMQTLDEASQGAKQILGQRSKRIHLDVEDIEELKQVVAHSHEVIAHAKTVLPFVFPHEIILDRTKITIIKRVFVWSSDVVSIRIEDALNVSASVGPMFGSVTIASRVMSSIDHFEVDRFWRNDAIRMKQIIQGYLIARQNGVHTDHLSCSELAETLYDISPGR